MKTIPVSFLVAGMLLPTVVLAQPENSQELRRPQESDARRKSMGSFAEAWARADADKNGVISMAEFGAMPRIRELPEDKRGELFARLDKNSDGSLGRDELDRFGKSRHDHGTPMKRLWELDLDKSGGVSFEEFKNGQVFQKLPAEKREAVFKRLDSDGDGLITPKDRPQGAGKRPEMKKRQLEADTPEPTRDGKEAKGPKVEGATKSSWLIRKFDENRDGELSFDEFRLAPDVKNLSEDEQEDRFEALDRNQDLRISAADFAVADTECKTPKD
jgi:Ca2+-binding EF-hand superfamily protein